MNAQRLDRLVTSGTFSLDGQTFDVDNNVWLLGDDDEVLVVDPAHDAGPVLEAVAGRRVVAVVCTHAHDDHVRCAPEVGDAVHAPVLLHPADRVLWEMTHPDRTPQGDLADGQVLEVAGAQVEVLHTPGHAPGAVCLHVPALGTVLTGDTLFDGGPGATGRSYSDRVLLERSIRERLLVLPPETVVRTGHGTDTTIGAEAERASSW